jgi:5-formyltetrahydrofolate cyclo-ligase
MDDPDDKLAENLGCGVTKLYRKQRMREELRRKLEEHGTCDSSGVVEEIREYLREKEEIRVVAMFSALPGEVDLRGLFGGEGRVWVYPKVVGIELIFLRVNCYERDMILGAYGIKEPKDGLEEYGVEEVDLFLCPGLGFDLKGGRLGRGKGFYDRVLVKARVEAIKLGVCFGWQILEEVVMEEHDVRMNGVIAG